MGHHVVQGLKWAMLVPQGPFAKVSRPRGAKAKGVRYEKDLAGAFGPAVQHGQWIKFEDRHGIGFAQPDILLPLGGELFILESKYTWVPEGHTQIEQLYRPLLECVFSSNKIYGLVVCKVLTQWAKQRATIVSSLDDGLEVARVRRPCALHWIGVGPLFRPPARAPLSAQALGI